MAVELVHVKGLAELNARIKQLPAKLQKQVIRKAVGAAAQVIKKAATQNAPRFPRAIKRGGGVVTQPGLLKSAAITKFLRSESNDDQTVFIVTFRQGKKAQSIGKNKTNKDAFYASWVEFGHKIVPRVRRIGRDVRGRLKNATSIRARRASSTSRVEGVGFLKKAFDTSGRQALQVMEDRIRSEFDKVTQ